MKMLTWRAAAVTGAVLSLAASGAAALVAKGKPAPAWSAKTTAGKTIGSSQLKGKVVLLNFFSYY